MYKEISEEEFCNEVNKIWYPKLASIFYEANRDVYSHTKQKLSTPNFDIMDNDKLWGQWCPSDRLIRIHQRLLRSYPWEAVEHVIRHEMAHMIVSEIWEIDDQVAPHGETFKRACKILDISSRSSDSSSYLSEFGYVNEDIVRKVKKLMALGQSSNQNEATSAMAKAHKLMRKHNVKDLHEEIEVFASRPIGVIGKRIPEYVRDICRILEKFYFVKYIGSYHRKDFVRYRHIEIFGKPENLDMAEYVFHFIYNQGNLHWEEFKKEQKDEGIPIKGNYSKSAFMEEFCAGYKHKLEKENGIKSTDIFVNDDGEEEDDKNPMTALLNLADNKLDERYRKKYPNLTFGRSYGGSMASGGNGYAKGNILKFRAGVSSSSRGNSITG